MNIEDYYKYLDLLNSRFNLILGDQCMGILEDNYIYQLGFPGPILVSSDFPFLEIELSSSLLKRKSLQGEHPFSLDTVYNLPLAIQDPLAVFRSATRLSSYVILTDLECSGKSIVVAIAVNKKYRSLEVNSIRSIHYRNSEMHIVNWINAGLANYISSEFLGDWLEPRKSDLLTKQQYNSADVGKRIAFATNIIRNFQNKQFSDEEFIELLQNSEFQRKCLCQCSKSIIDEARKSLGPDWKESIRSKDDEQVSESKGLKL